MLHEIAGLGMLTTGQVERLAFPSRRRAQRRLRAYLDRGLVRAHLQGDALHKDNVWTVTSSGLNFLAARGAEVEGLTPHRPRVRSQKLRHAVFVRDVAVTLLVAEAAGLVGVDDLRLEGQLAGEPALRSAGLVPDGYAVLERGNIRRIVVWEVATEMQPLAQIRDKLLLYERASAGGPTLFRSSRLRVLMVIENARRLENATRTANSLAVAGRTVLVGLPDVLDSVGLVERLFVEEVGFGVVP